MSNNRIRHPRRAAPATGAGFGRMLLASLVLHGVAAALLAGVVRAPHAKPPAPYRVELVSLPVPRPQAGLPGATEKPVVAPVRPTIPKTETAPVRPSAKPAATVLKPVKEKPLAKPASKPAPAAAAKDDYQDTLDEIARLKRLKEIRDTRQRLERMIAEAQQRKVATAPVGAPTGQGNQAGGDYLPWIKAQITEYWTLSRYQVTRFDLEATVRIEFDARGVRSGYRFTDTSNDARFDDSIRRAILQLDRLPTAPEKPLQLEIKFNLKDLLER